MNVLGDSIIFISVFGSFDRVHNFYIDICNLRSTCYHQLAVYIKIKFSLVGHSFGVYTCSLLEVRFETKMCNEPFFPLGGAVVTVLPLYDIWILPNVCAIGLDNKIKQREQRIPLYQNIC